MSRLGSVVGPFPGLFWLDIATHQAVFRQGRPGIAAEIHVQLTPDQAAGLIEGLLVEPVQLGAPEQTAPLVLVERKPKPTTRSGRQATAAARPTSINCAVCRRPREVLKFGAIPQLCERCQRRGHKNPTSVAVAEAERPA